MSGERGENAASEEIPLHRSKRRSSNSDDYIDECRLTEVCNLTSTMSERFCNATMDNDRDPRLIASTTGCPVGIPGIYDASAVAEALQSFVRAVHEKYNADTEIDEAVGNVVYIPKAGPVKMTASGNIMLPRQVSMSGCEISVAGDVALIERMCQRVHELDLMENHITCWDEVFSIIECIPHLTFLNLTKNQITSDLPELQGRRLPNLTHLVLNNTMITWDVLMRLLEAFPSLEELHLSLNGFETVELLPSSTDSTISTYPSLRKLFFIGNKITDWQEINKLGSFFPNLLFLLMSETELSSISGEDDIAEAFPALHTLGLNRTRLRSWHEVEKLRLFPALMDVKMNGLPFLEALPELFRRQHAIALLPNVSMLNGSPVLDNEREDAERAFIRLYMDKSERPDRYHELERQHGKLAPLVHVELKPKNNVKLTIQVEGPDREIEKTEVLDVGVNSTVKELKKMLSNIAGRPMSKVTLFYKNDLGVDQLRCTDRKLFSYMFSDGDIIIIACSV